MQTASTLRAVVFLGVLVGLWFCSLLAARDFNIPLKVYWIALPYGILAVVAGLAFQAGIHYGKISTSWLVIDIPVIVPADSFSFLSIIIVTSMGSCYAVVTNCWKYFTRSLFTYGAILHDAFNCLDAFAFTQLSHLDKPRF